MGNDGSIIRSSIRNDGVFEGKRISEYLPSLRDNSFYDSYLSIAKYLDGPRSVDLIRCVVSVDQGRGEGSSFDAGTTFKIERIDHFGACDWRYVGVLAEKVPKAELEQRLRSFSEPLIDEASKR